MGPMIGFLQRYLAPFVAGVFFAGATVAHNIPVAVLLVLVGCVFGFLSLPAGDRMIRRITGMPI